MKARIRLPEAPKTALCAGFSAARLQALSAVLIPQGIAVRFVAPRELGQTVGALAGTDPPAAIPADFSPRHADTESLVLCGLGSGELDALLASLREAGLSIPCKAVLTPVNRGWRFDDLIGQLADEHEAVMRRFAERKGR